MSNLTHEQLANNVLVGFTEKRGTAWWYRAGDEDSHYEGAVPLADVMEKIFCFEAIDAPCYSGVPVAFDDEGKVTDWYPLKDETRKYIIRSDNHVRLGLAKKGYAPHQPKPWLIDNISNILDDDVQISSAGALDEGRKLWVEVSVPENLVTPDGIEYRPNLYGATSFDSTMKTTFGRNATMIVCDNTFDVAVNEDGQKIAYKHTANSNANVMDAREALNIIFEGSDHFEQFTGDLVNAPFSDSQWEKFLELYVPIDFEHGAKRGVTEGTAKREELDTLYRSDARCKNWAGTEFGVFQTVSTWTHHLRPAKKATNRGDRNLAEGMNGKTAEVEQNTLKLIAAAR